MVLLSYYGLAATKLYAILSVEKFSWGAQTCSFSNVFFIMWSAMIMKLFFH